MTIDFEVYLRTRLCAHAHSAEAVLSRVRAPTLITAGDKDRMTPVCTAERMHRDIVGSQFTVISGGTDYSPIEFPGRFRGLFDGFVARFETTRSLA